MIGFLDVIRVVLLFKKLDAQLDRVKSVSENFRFQLRLRQPSGIQRLRLNVGLDLITPPPIGALL